MRKFPGEQVQPSHAKFPILPWIEERNNSGVQIFGVCFSILDPTRARMATFLHYSLGGKPGTIAASLIFQQVWKTYHIAFGDKLPVEKPGKHTRFVVTPIGLFKPFFANKDTGLDPKTSALMQTGTWYAIIESDLSLDDFLEWSDGLSRAI